LAGGDFTTKQFQILLFWRCFMLGPHMSYHIFFLSTY